MKTQSPKSQTKGKSTSQKTFLVKPDRILNWILSGVFVLFILFLTIGQNPDFLWKLQNLDLFSFSSDYFVHSTQRVGGLSMYIGSFLNQFFYYPLAGSLLYLFLLLLVCFLTIKVFRLKGWFLSLAFIPSLTLLLTMTQLGYMIYFLKISGYVYNNVLGILVILIGLLIWNRLNKNYKALVFTVAYLIIGYPLFGAFSLFGGLLMVLTSLKNFMIQKQRIDLIHAVSTFSSIVVIPIFYYWFIFDQIAFSEIYTANLPYFLLNAAEIMFWLPFAVLGVFFIVMSIWNQNPAPNTILTKLSPVLIFCACLAVVYHFSFKDTNFNTEISMQVAAEKEDWNHVLKIARKQKVEPTRLIVMTTNLALYKLGLASDKMFHYENGNKEYNSPRTIVPIHMSGMMMYYQYGILNYSYKWCMENMVEYGFNGCNLKYFVLSSLLKGDLVLAQKYNDILKTTLFYKPLALKLQGYIDHPETITTAQEFKNILALTAYDDLLDGDYYDLEAFLRNHFSKLRVVPKELAELSVMFNLDIKVIDQFWPRLFLWVRLNPKKNVPIHFQEAALLYESLEHKVDISGAPFNKEVLENFKNFQNMVKQYVGYPEESLKPISKNRFGDTFWHYYFFVKDSNAKPAEDKGYQQ